MTFDGKGKAAGSNRQAGVGLIAHRYRTFRRLPYFPTL